MKQLPNVDPRKLIWPEPQRKSAMQVVVEAFKTLICILALLSLYAFQMTLDTEARLEDEKLARLKANERTAALMNGRALVDQENGVAYIPDGYITGLSKIARVVEVFARRLQVQERLTTQIKECIQKTLNPMGVMVVIEAQHMCMQMRGVEKQNSITTTSDFTGVFKEQKTREEFIALIK